MPQTPIHRALPAVLFATLLALPLPAAAQMDDPVIMVDAGHGGDEIGVELPGVHEKDVVLRLAYAVAAELVEAGYDVRLTRTGDYAVTWDDRRAAAESEGAALLIMLHANGDDDPAAHGAEIYTSDTVDVSQRASAAFANALRAGGSHVVEEPRDWPFLQSATVPTVMIEAAFLTNPTERRLLLSDAFHHELGAQMVAAVDAFLGR